ncbi:winged helix-turn-helix transcriptional regulator [Trinickia mobilis]|uniref:winged helix-turn-helix transcriptional regulator n=1 Tax=Trinickia mobilis TaxID=2816356 RepID=UPI001A90949C|nr:helix-turn-helix domain-containing protein [Trinickia mobilis]
MRRTCLKTAECPVARSLDIVGDWWTLLIVRDALKGVRRFGEFQKNLGMAKNILSTRLREMVAAGIMETRPAEDGSAHSEYHLTEAGQRLQTVLVALRQWGEQYLFAPGEPMMMAVDKEKEEPIRRLELMARDGRALTSADIAIQKGRAPHPAKSSRRVSRPAR